MDRFAHRQYDNLGNFDGAHSGYLVGEICGKTESDDETITVVSTVTAMPESQQVE
jgi:hypothetical protein